MSTTTEQSVSAPSSAVGEPTIFERLAALEETAVRLAEDRDAANLRAVQRTEERDAERARADRAEALCMVLETRDRERGAALRDLARQLAEAQRALSAATPPVQPADADDPTAPLPRAFDAPRRPVRRPSWRRPRRRD